MSDILTISTKPKCTKNIRNNFSIELGLLCTVCLDGASESETRDTSVMTSLSLPSKITWTLRRAWGTKQTMFSLLWKFYSHNMKLFTVCSFTGNPCLVIRFEQSQNRCCTRWRHSGRTVGSRPGSHSQKLRNHRQLVCWGARIPTHVQGPRRASDCMHALGIPWSWALLELSGLTGERRLAITLQVPTLYDKVWRVVTIHSATCTWTLFGP